MSPPSVLGVGLPPKDWGEEIRKVSERLTREHDERLAAQLEILKLNEGIRSSVVELGRKIDNHADTEARKSKRRAWVTSGLSTAVIGGLLTMLGNVWVAKIGQQSRGQADATAGQTVDKRLEGLEDRIKRDREETIRAMLAAQQKLQRDPDLLTARK